MVFGRKKGEKDWSKLGGLQKAGVIIAGVVQVALMSAALLDLRRRPSREIRGSKHLWKRAVFVNYIGPLAYFAVGRKR